MFKPTTTSFYHYDNIPLRLYFEVAESSDYERLQLSGEYDAEKALDVWEDIVKRNSEENGSHQYYAYINSHKGLNKLLNDYTMTKAMLIKLAFVVDKKLIERLNKMGYRISTKNSQEYEDSLVAAIRKSDNMVTKITMRQNELNTLFKAQEGNKSKRSFEQVIADLTVGLGFIVNEDITLARYNEYRKIIQKKHELAKSKGRNGRA
jgi:hypothetical protein